MASYAPSRPPLAKPSWRPDRHFHPLPPPTPTILRRPTFLRQHLHTAPHHHPPWYTAMGGCSFRLPWLLRLPRPLTCASPPFPTSRVLLLFSDHASRAARVRPVFLSSSWVPHLVPPLASGQSSHLVPPLASGQSSSWVPHLFPPLASGQSSHLVPPLASGQSSSCSRRGASCDMPLSPSSTPAGHVYVYVTATSLFIWLLRSTTTVSPATSSPSRSSISSCPSPSPPATRCSGRGGVLRHL